VGRALLRTGALLLLDAPGRPSGEMALGNAFGASFAAHTQLVGRLSTRLDDTVEHRPDLLCSAGSRGLSAPAHHRVHHASNPEYLDANFGGVLIVFDRLFGTFVAERPGVAIRYGLVEPIRSNNPIYIGLHRGVHFFGTSHARHRYAARCPPLSGRRVHRYRRDGTSLGAAGVAAGPAFDDACFHGVGHDVRSRA
jgi:hypothetical protein